MSLSEFELLMDEGTGNVVVEQRQRNDDGVEDADYHVEDDDEMTALQARTTTRTHVGLSSSRRHCLRPRARASIANPEATTAETNAIATHSPSHSHNTHSGQTLARNARGLQMQSPPPIPYGDIDEDDDDDSVIHALSWRLDPKQSLSDWTFQVVVKGSIRIDLYHVHKSVLAVGPRRSAYFAHTFHKASKQRDRKSSDPGSPNSFEHSSVAYSNVNDAMSVAPSLKDSIDVKNSSNRVELHRLAAETIPVVLDYVYSVNGELDISTQNASALHYLSQHLSIKSLRKAARQFWQEDVCVENVAVYYGHARIFKDDKIIDFLVDYVAEHIFEVTDALVVDILTAIDPVFFCRVVQAICAEYEDGAASLRLSLLVTVYCNIHTVELSANMFNRLTAPEFIPKLETKAAKVLLDLERNITTDRNMTSLKERAIEVLSLNWDEACIENNDGEGQPEEGEAVSVSLPCLIGEPLEQFTEKSLKNAYERLNPTGDEVTIPKLLARIKEMETRSPGQAERLLTLERRQTETLNETVLQLNAALESQKLSMEAQQADLTQQLEDARHIIEAQKEQLKASARKREISLPKPPPSPARSVKSTTRKDEERCNDATSVTVLTGPHQEAVGSSIGFLHATDSSCVSNLSSHLFPTSIDCMDSDSSSSSCPPAPVESPSASAPPSRADTPDRLADETTPVTTPNVADDPDHSQDQIRLLSPISTALMVGTDHASLASSLMDTFQQPTSTASSPSRLSRGDINDNYDIDDGDTISTNKGILPPSIGSAAHELVKSVSTVDKSNQNSSPFTKRVLSLKGPVDDDPSETTNTTCSVTERAHSPALSVASISSTPTEGSRATEILDKILGDPALQNSRSLARKAGLLATKHDDRSRSTPASVIPGISTHSAVVDRKGSPTRLKFSSTPAKTIVTPSGHKVVLRRTNPS